MNNQVIIVKDYEEMSCLAYEYFKEQLKNNPKTVWGLATGSTPVGLYKKLCDSENLDFSNCTSFNLDEYEGLKQDDIQSYCYFMNENLFSKINIHTDKCFLPLGCAEDLDKECLKYDNMINLVGGIDFQVLGIGTNGHIGFNEPSESFSEGTHVVDLTDQTIKDNGAKYFNNNMELVPKRALSMGTLQIAKAKKIIILASGKNKALAVASAINGPVTPNVPASILQTCKDVIWIIDEAAASMLKI